ncbi:MAG: hypothetical protein NTW87_23165 [Planctomycetota bacterium]|nr:hypothetical protein [Planctomycetota bacterium]
MDYSRIKGFNYQPSWGSTGFEIWRNFDAERLGHELALGKLYFPKMNAIRLWLSHDAWLRNPKRFHADLAAALGLAASHGLSVMPVLFNRWHDATLDYGGIYLDHLLPKASWVQGKDQPAAFAEEVLGAHATDSRVLAWDLCNEPFSYGCAPAEIPEVVKAEYAWLEKLYQAAKRLGVAAPITVGIHPGHGMDGIRQVEPISDVLSIHPYWTCDSPSHDKAAYEKLLDGYVQFSQSLKKPLLATETCWGATDDAKRVEIIRYTLGQLKKRGIGWLVYLLHHSLIADAHRPEFGPVGFPEYLGFIEADGSLRRGHEVFNEF